MRNLGLGFGVMLYLATPVGCGPLASDQCQGAVKCACYGKSTCNAGLTCVSSVCVALSADAGAPPPGLGDGAPQLFDAQGSDGAEVPQNDGSAAAVSQASEGGYESAAPAIGTNLVTNGDFSQGSSEWSIVSGTGQVTAMGGQLCVSVAAMQSATLGWPEPQGTPGPPLVAGASYTFAYSAEAMPAIAIDAKVGHTAYPYGADFETPAGGDAVPSTWMQFSHTFTAPTQPAEDSAGIAFQLPDTGNAATAIQVCFENVSLVQN